MTSDFIPNGNFSDPLPSYVKYAIGIEDCDERYRDIHGLLDDEIEVDKYYLLLDTEFIEGSGGSRLVYLYPIDMSSNGIIPSGFINGWELLQHSAYRNR